MPFEEGKKELQTKDKIIIYTDGVIEFQDDKGGIYGEDRFYVLLKKLKDQPIRKIIDEVFKSLREFGNNTNPKDDVSLLGIEFTGNRSPR